MSAHRIEVNTRADALRLIHTLQQTGCAHRIPLVQATLDGRIAHLEIQRTGCAGKLKRFLAQARGPALILAGDDDDEPSGPAGWPQAERIIRWARLIVLHGAGAEAWHYRTTISTAEAVGRVAMVECCTSTLPAWLAASRRWAPATPTQIIAVPDGQPPHPAQAKPETVQ